MKIVNGKMVTESPTDIEQRALDDVRNVDKRREFRRGQFRVEAGARISALFGGKTGDSLVIAQLNMQARSSEIINAKADGVATQAEIDELAIYQGILAQIKAIRIAENTASAELDAKGTDENQTPAERIAEIDAVVAVWP